MSGPPPAIFICNGAAKPKDFSQDAKIINLSYLRSAPDRNVNLQLPRFVDQVYHLPDRILDLLEIAAYVFAADRWTHRGSKDAVEYHAWARSIHFVIRVRDHTFWSEQKVKGKLSDVLKFMTGDREYTFEFSPGHKTPPTSLFDHEEFKIEARQPVSIILFSGGLDSLAGVLNRLHSTNEDIYLISHRSGQPSTRHTQDRLAEVLAQNYPGRIHHYSFECGLSHKRAEEETQRTRAFLFGSIAFALAHRLSQNHFFVYENGVTSLNLLRRQDLINARASRTTHPKTHDLMSAFLSEVQGASVQVLNPFWQHTKTDVFQLLDHIGGRNLIGSTVSCSKTFQRLGTATHCGCCFQCIDRRFAAYAAGLQEIDNCGIYSKNIFIDSIDSPETKTTSLDYIRQAISFATSTDDKFYYDHLNELVDIVDYIDATSEANAVEKLWQLCHRHGEQVVAAIKKIRQLLDDPCCKVHSDSLLKLIADREYMKDNARRLAERIAERLNKGIPIAFQKRFPERENEVNNMIQAILQADKDVFRREFPSTTFALSKVIPDHEAIQQDLLIEAKYIRKKTTPSIVSDGIASDITKYSSAKLILFVVYDPHRGISQDDQFIKDIEGKRNCIVSIIR